MKNMIVLTCVVLLGGCAQIASVIQPKVEMDIAGATKRAIAIGDTQGAVCWPAVGALLDPPPTGLADTYEVFRGANIIATGPCSPLFAGLAVHVINKVPFTP